MALTHSTMVTLGSTAPDFELPNPATGSLHSRDELKKAKGLLVIFMCNHCPYVKHLLTGLKQLAVDYADSEIGIVGISSNDIDAYPEDAPELMATLNPGFLYLYDETQAVAKAFDAVCTPEFYLYDGDLQLVYRGQFDDSRPGNNIAVSGQDLRNAMNQVLSGGEINKQQKPGMGCNIKWRT